MATASDRADLNPVQLWTSEYERKGIPSSAREAPSNVVVDFVDFVRLERLRSLRALDVGCGAGRNSLYLAHNGFSVCALDFAPGPVAQLRSRARELALPIEARVHDISEAWPLPNEAFDVAIDAFCFKHLIPEEAIYAYVSEVERCLSRGGLFMLFLATKEDGYYKQFPSRDQSGVGTIITDPGNGIASRLYSRADIDGLFSCFQGIHFQVKQSQNTMHGRAYDRSSALWYFRKP